MKRPQTDGICERFHRTVLNEFCRVAFRKKIYTRLEDLQADLLTRVQRGAAAPGPVVLWQDPDADVSGQRALAKEKVLAA